MVNGRGGNGRRLPPEIILTSDSDTELPLDALIGDKHYSLHAEVPLEASIADKHYALHAGDSFNRRALTALKVWRLYISTSNFDSIDTL